MSCTESLTKQSGVNWAKLPEPVTPRFYESTRNRQITAIALAALAISLVFVAGAVGAFAAAPALGLIAVATACAVTALVLVCLRESFNDPNHRLHLRQEAGKHLMSHPEMGYDAIRNKYVRALVSDQDINILIAKDAKELTYEAFIQKHGNSVIYILNPENISVLRPKFIKHCREKLNLNEIQAQSGSLIQFGLRDEKWVEVAMREARAALQTPHAYHTFFSRNPLSAIELLKQDADLFNAMLVKTEEYDLKLDLGVTGFMGTAYYKQAHEHIGNEFAEKMIETIRINEFEKFKAGQLDYIQFKERNGTATHTETDCQSRMLPDFPREVFKYAASFPKSMAGRAAVEDAWRYGGNEIGSFK